MDSLPQSALYSSAVERAMRFAAEAHLTHFRKGTDIPYLTHLAGVTLILARAGFDRDHVLCAALLHDCVEDTAVSLDEITYVFGNNVANLVDAVAETKRDNLGNLLPWRVRKEELLRRLAQASIEAGAIALADKIHNLGTLIDDLANDPGVWARFNSSPEEQIWYYEAVFDAVGASPSLSCLTSEGRRLIQRLKDLVPPTSIAT